MSAKGYLCLVLAGSLMPAAMAQQSLPIEQRVNALFFGEMDYREREDLGGGGSRGNEPDSSDGHT